MAPSDMHFDSGDFAISFRSDGRQHQNTNGIPSSNAGFVARWVGEGRLTFDLSLTHAPSMPTPDPTRWGLDLGSAMDLTGAVIWGTAAGHAARRKEDLSSSVRAVASGASMHAHELAL